LSCSAIGAAALGMRDASPRPKAKELLDKAFEALMNKLDQAEKICRSGEARAESPRRSLPARRDLLRRGQRNKPGRLEKTTQIDHKFSCVHRVRHAFMNENKYDSATAPVAAIHSARSQMAKPLDAARVLYRQGIRHLFAEAQQALSQSHGSQPELNCDRAIATAAASSKTPRNPSHLLRTHPAIKARRPPPLARPPRRGRQGPEVFLGTVTDWHLLW